MAIYKVLFPTTIVLVLAGITIPFLPSLPVYHYLHYNMKTHSQYNRGLLKSCAHSDVTSQTKLIGLIMVQKKSVCMSMD